MRVPLLFSNKNWLKMPKFAQDVNSCRANQVSRGLNRSSNLLLLCLYIRERLSETKDSSSNLLINAKPELTRQASNAFGLSFHGKCVCGKLLSHDARACNAGYIKGSKKLFQLFLVNSFQRFCHSLELNQNYTNVNTYIF